mgnify:CR=1 FL=1
MIDAALNTIGMTKPRDARVVRIANTLQLEEVMVSESLAHEVGVRDVLAARVERRHVCPPGSNTLSAPWGGRGPKPS